MPATLSRIRIEGLYSSRTIDVPLEGNRLVLVGDNGTGKSTLLNFIYSILTKQWHRLAQYTFQRVQLVLNDETVEIERSDLDLGYPNADRARLYRAWASGQHGLPSETMRTLEDRVISGGLTRSELENLLLGIPTARNMEDSPNIHRANDLVTRATVGEVLYLPTYRRVEQDLEAVFPGHESEVRRLRQLLERRVEGEASVSLVRFGMEDVQETIHRVMSRLKDKARNSLTDLTWAYLRDLLSGDDQRFDPAVLQQLDESTLEVVFSRIDEQVLPAPQRQSLKDLVKRVKDSGEVEEEDRVAFGFLARLATLYAEQQAEERNVRDFVEICNHYLVEKRLAYDTTNFTVTIRSANNDVASSADVEASIIPLKALSSGEKQIISLFATLLLSSAEKYFVIIDEPELSLSVPWQRHLLPDVVGTERVAGLVAATHSPFIFDNDLDPYTHAMSEFTEVRHAAGD